MEQTKKTEQEIVISFVCGILIPLSAIKHAIRKYCWENDLRVEFSQAGFLVRDCVARIWGRMTDSEARRHKYNIECWFEEIA